MPELDRDSKIEIELEQTQENKEVILLGGIPFAQERLEAFSAFVDYLSEMDPELVTWAEVAKLSDIIRRLEEPLFGDEELK